MRRIASHSLQARVRVGADDSLAAANPYWIHPRAGSGECDGLLDLYRAFIHAHESTIFLDEIGELPFDLQAKLLRALQEGAFEPVGSGRHKKVEVRVVAATDRDLRREASEGRFREDLFYRLNVFPIQLPPLRERPEDIPLLAEAFARRFAQRLRAYAWPGNVRELENVVERAVITAVAGRMNFARALPEVVPPPAEECAPENLSDRILSAAELKELERRNYVRALETCAWRVSGDSGAARMLGLNPLGNADLIAFGWRKGKSTMGGLGKEGP